MKLAGVRRLAVAAFLALGLTQAAAAEREQLREYLSTLEAFGFTGPVVVEQDGKVVLAEAYGLADRSRNIRFTNDTVFYAASFSKTITATAVMQLVERGQISLSDPLSRFFPDAPADKRAITVAQVLSHSAGLDRDSLGRKKIETREECVAAVLSAPLTGKPGEHFAYSNDGYHLLAAIIEIVSKRPFRDAVREAIFVPARMTSAGFAGEQRWSPERIPHGYNEWSDLGTFSDLSGGAWKHEGAGSVVATAEDLRRFMEAYFGGRLVRPDTATLMTTIQARAAEADGDAYGYGWFVTKLGDGQALIYHGGDQRGAHTEVRWYPAKKRTIILSTSQELFDESGFGLGVQKRVIASNLSRIMNGSAPTLSLSAHAISEAEAKRLIGSYGLADGAGAFEIYRPQPYGPLWIGAEGQAAIDALEHPEDMRRARFAAANERSMALTQAIVTQDKAKLAVLLPKDLHFFIDGWVRDFQASVEQRGAFAGIELVGTRSEITGESDVRTMLRLKFAKSSYDFSFTWHGDALYESMTETGAPAALMLPLAATGPDAFAALEFVGQTITPVQSNGAGLEPYSEIKVGGLAARRH